MENKTKWTVIGAASVLGLGVATLGAVSAANAINFVTTGELPGIAGITVGDDRPSSDIPSTLSPSSSPSPTSSASPQTPDTPDTPPSPASPVSPASAVTPPSPASPVSPASVDSPESPESND